MEKKLIGLGQKYRSDVFMFTLSAKSEESRYNQWVRMAHGRAGTSKGCTFASVWWVSVRIWLIYIASPQTMGFSNRKWRFLCSIFHLGYGLNFYFYFLFLKYFYFLNKKKEKQKKKHTLNYGNKDYSNHYSTRKTQTNQFN